MNRSVAKTTGNRKSRYVRRRRGTGRLPEPQLPTSSPPLWVEMGTPCPGKASHGVGIISGVRYETIVAREAIRRHVQLRARIARVPRMSAELAVELLQFQAASSFSRWAWDPESGILALEAVACVPPGMLTLPAVTEMLFRDFANIFEDGRAISALLNAKAHILGSDRDSTWD